jgi:FkbM family methyltransferase
MTAKSERTFLPAAGHDFLLPIYDPFTKLFGFDRARRMLLDQAALQPQHRVLDVGCGTGTLAVLIKRLYPTINVVALDPDPKALARAQRKAERAAVSIRFDRGFSDALGYPDAAFDRVFSSMMFHHLDRRTKAVRWPRYGASSSRVAVSSSSISPGRSHTDTAPSAA